MTLQRSVSWNEKLRLVLSDVDETVADLYRPAEQGMLDALAQLLDQGIALVLITGQSVDNVEQRVVMRLPARLRRQIAVGGCSGAELWGYGSDGARKAAPYYTVENTLSPAQKNAWRHVCSQLIDEFHLVPSPPGPPDEFKRRHGDELWQVMFEDRGPQITFEFPNAYALSEAACDALQHRTGTSFEGRDYRIPVQRRAQQLLEAHAVPVTPRIAGMFALDLAIAGIDKARAVAEALTHKALDDLGLGPTPPRREEMEVWGDRFSQSSGTDWLMCKPIDRGVRAISFRDEDPAEFPDIQRWDGERRLHAGLLEFLENR
jgi:hypothetical protein